MKGKNVEHWRGYRHPKTTQERRASQEGWGRKRRNKANLPCSYDDKCHSSSYKEVKKGWKHNRKKQYREKPRGKKRRIFVPVQCEHVAGYSWRRHEAAIQQIMQERNISHKTHRFDEVYESDYVWSEWRGEWRKARVFKGTTITYWD